jgi:hypothetical protein
MPASRLPALDRETANQTPNEVQVTGYSGSRLVVSRLLERFPPWRQVLPVYAVIAFIVYAWALLWFFWKLPGWMFFLNSDSILSALTYVLATNLVESLLVLCGPLALAFLLPRRWFRDVFVARGAALSMAALGCMMFLADRFKDKIAYPELPLSVWAVPAVFALIAFAAYLGGRVPLVRSVLEAVADRVTIFVYILIPASLVSVIAILIRLALR